ncbi:MAG: hypothetical protein JW819_02610 [Candidatus Krumholzibacteriota bacterium]|nr:hypothetical protein [Candidatus Krumholzibacteriota bacterium]
MLGVLAALLVLFLLLAAALLARPGRGRGARCGAAASLAAALLLPALILVARPPAALPSALGPPPVRDLLITSHLLPAAILAMLLAGALALRLRAGRRLANGARRGAPADGASSTPGRARVAAGFHAGAALLAAAAALEALALDRWLHRDGAGALLAVACLGLAAVLSLLPRGEAEP